MQKAVEGVWWGRRVKRWWPDGDGVVMKGNDDEVGGEQSFSAFPQVRAARQGHIPADNLLMSYRIGSLSALASQTSEEFGQSNT
jgi:hypothetical protein